MEMTSGIFNISSIAVDVLAPPLSHRRDKNVSQPRTFQKQNKEIVLILPKCDIFDDSPKKIKRDVTAVKQLSKRISFDKNVVEERSPHTIPFSEWNHNKTYNNNISKKEKKNYNTLLLERANENRPVPKNTIQSKQNTDVLIGVESKISCSDLLLALPKTKSKPSIKDESVMIENNFSTSHQWKDRVISKLSKGTVDMILQDEKPLITHNESLLIRNSSNSKFKKSEVSKSENENEKNNLIISDTNDFYFKNIKKVRKKKISLSKKAYPSHPAKWLNSDSINKKDSSTQIVYGAKKWSAFPEVDEQKDFVLQQVSETNVMNELVRLPTIKDNSIPSYELIPVLKEWGKKWVPSQDMANKSLTDLKADLMHISEHVRCLAVLSAASLLCELQEIKDEENIIFNKVTCLLDDESCLVSLSAALFLFCLNKPSEKAKDKLLKFSMYGHPAERWVAVRCLAFYNYHDSCIIRELISSVTSNDRLKWEPAKNLLRELSQLTLTVQYMVAEKLNSGSWSDRVTACQVLPDLHGNLTKDIANKLTCLFWNDWSKNVRKAALEALGKSGNGKLVHHLLCEYLTSVKSDDKITALKMIGSLGIMTTQLISRLLLSLSSDNDEVCLQSVKLCMKMKLKDSVIIDALVALMKSTRAVKIKIFTIRAFGEVGSSSDVAQENILWALHFSKDAKLRREACSTVIKLNLCGEEIINVLQEIVYIDEDASVRKEGVRALYNMGLQAVGYDNLTQTIRKSIKQLCHRENVIARVVEGKTENIFIDSSDDDDDDSRSHCSSFGLNDIDEGQLYSRYNVNGDD